MRAIEVKNAAGREPGRGRRPADLRPCPQRDGGGEAPTAQGGSPI